MGQSLIVFMGKLGQPCTMGFKTLVGMLGGCDLVRMRGRGGTLDCVWERGLGDGLGFEVDGFFREVGGNYRQMM